MLVQTICILSFAVTVCSAYFAREGFMIVIPANEESCFSKNFTSSIKVIFEYMVVAGGNQDIDVRIITPNGLIIYNEEKKINDEVSFDAQNGDYKFCFNNEFSKLTAKRIAFNVRPYDEGSVVEEARKNAQQVKGPLEAFCDNINFLMLTVMDFQMKYMVRESMGRYVAEHLNKRVMWWSLGQTVIIVITGFGQVFIFKKFFTDSRHSTKPHGIQTST